ncbi:hypothetical protein FRC04_004156 [Tulasnella sp. 424]|nr:hypothetical protein FRC04_004156 [Tulasnella sp. 424]
MNHNSMVTTQNPDNQTSITISEVPYKIDTTHLYPDGNLIVLVENTAFRVFQSFLTRRSGVIESALALPQPQRLNNPESPVRIRRDTFDGAPVLQLDGPAVDFTLLLDVVLPQTCATVPISTKTKWSRLLGLAQIAQNGLTGLGAQSTPSIIHWARSCEFHQFLPMAFYYLVTGEWQFDPRNRQAMESLSARDQLRAQQGQAQLQAAVVRLALSRWENYPIGNSKLGNRCPDRRFHCWVGYGGKIWPSGDNGTRWTNLLLHPLEELQMRADGKVANLSSVCEYCRGAFVAANRSMIDYIVKELETLLKLEDEGAAFRSRRGGLILTE